jgi:hypothetical protein
MMRTVSGRELTRRARRLVIRASWSRNAHCPQDAFGIWVGCVIFHLLFRLPQSAERSDSMNVFCVPALWESEKPLTFRQYGTFSKQFGHALLECFVFSGVARREAVPIIFMFLRLKLIRQWDENLV